VRDRERTDVSLQHSVILAATSEELAMIRTFLHGTKLKSQSHRQRSRRARGGRLWELEGLENRMLLSGSPTVYTVNLTTDAGPTSAGSGTGDTGDLRYCINLANSDPNPSGTMIEFDPTVFSTAQTIVLSSTLGTLTLSNTVAPEMIDASTVTGPVTISGNKLVEVFNVQSDVTASINDLSIIDGNGVFGGGMFNDGALTITNTTFAGNSGQYGGALYTRAGGSNPLNGFVTLTGDTFTGNSATALSGAIDNWAGGTVTVTDDTFTGNSAPNGGAIGNEWGSVAVSGSTFSNNTASTGAGGAIINYNPSDSFTNSLLVVGSTISGNSAANGGGIANSGPDTLSLTNDTIMGNSATGNGGGIANTGALTLTADMLENNTAGADGGGIDNGPNSNAIVTNTSFANNTATDDGGGVANESVGSLTIIGSTFANNSAADGGGLSNAGSALLTNCTIATNVASVDGGGVFDQGPATLALTACTVADNTAATGGGLYNASPSAIASLIDTIVAANIEPGGTPDDINGTDAGNVAGSFNLIGIGGSGGISNGQNGNIVLTSLANLGLSALGDYGGPTETIALLSGSAAIGNGTAASGVTTDQRGFPSDSPKPDIGAFQTQPDLLLVNTIADGVGTLPGKLTLRQAVNLANVLLTGATITFDPTVFGSAPEMITLTAGSLVLSNAATPEAIDGPSTASLTISGGGTLGVFQVNSGVTASITDLTITGGSAAAGGAINNSGLLAVSNSTIVGNTAGSGGGIYNTGFLTLTNSTLDGNTATSQGGGAFFGGGTATIVNSTVADNAVTGITGSTLAGGGLFVSSGTNVINNTIVALNTSGQTNSMKADDIAGTALSSSSGFNLIGTGGAGGLTNGVDGNQVGVANPGLGPLTNNGGPTATIALLPGSPAIDAGSNALAVGPNGSALITDQRGAGFPRIVNFVVDTGAFERAAPSSIGNPTVYTVNLTSASGATSGALSGDLVYVVNQADANPNPAGSVIQFDPTVFSTEQTITLTGTLMLSPPAGPITIDGPSAGVIISGNAVVGVFQLARNATASLKGLTIEDGSASSGGGILSNLASTLTLTNDDFNDNAAVFYGGAVYNNGGTLTVTGSTFSNNTAVNGLGAAIDNAGTLTVADSSFTFGNAYQGGAIDNKSGSLTVTDSSFEFNIAIMGGGIFNDAAATIIGSTIANNSAMPATTGGTAVSYVSFDGGAIANDLNGVMTLTNSTLADNAAGQNGGAIDTVGVLTAVNDTIAYNMVAAGGAGGGVSAPSGTPTFYNTIIAQNSIGSGSTATASDIAGNVSLQSAYNLIGTGSGGLTNGTNNNMTGVTSPGLGVLAANGGATETIALLKGSPAIDAGSNALAVNPEGNPLITDQRGGNIVFTGTLTTGSASVTGVSSTSGLVVGQTITGTGIAAGTTILAINSASANITLSANATATGSESLSAYFGIFPRIVNKLVDIGAFEAGTTSIYTVDLTSDTGASTGPDSGDLLYCINLANADQNPSGALIQFNPAKFSTAQTINLTSGPLVLTNTSTPITVTGPGANLLTINGDGSTGVLQVAAGVTASISGLTITGGSAQTVGSINGDGGGIDNSGSLTLNNMALAHNSAINGGGLANEATGTLKVSNSTFSSDSGTTGGGIYNVGTMTVTNVTAADNTAVVGAGVFSAGTLTMVNSTVAYNNVNFAGSGGGLDVASGSTANLYNTLIALNTTTNNSHVSSPSDIFGTVGTTSANNLIGTGGAGGLKSGTNGNLVGVANPGLAPAPGLANNGGQTQTIALVAGSPAIGAGAASFTTPSGTLAAPSVDQRGITRPSSSISIGAYQFVPTPGSQALRTAPSAPPAAPSSGAGSTAAVTHRPVVTARTAKKLVVSKKPLPHGGSTTKFLSRSKAVTPKRTFALVAKHASVGAKKKV
jgi:hypothetical protein